MKPGGFPVPNIGFVMGSFESRGFPWRNPELVEWILLKTRKPLRNALVEVVPENNSVQKVPTEAYMLSVCSLLLLKDFRKMLVPLV